MSHYITIITTLLTYYLKLHGPASSAILPSLTVYLGNKSLTIIASYEGIQDSFRFWIPRCRFRNLFQWITWFLDSNRLTCISGFKAQNLGFRNKNCPNSGFHKQKFPGFQNPLHGVIIKNNQWKQGTMI